MNCMPERRLTAAWVRVRFATSKPTRFNFRICCQFMYFEVSLKLGRNLQMKKVAPNPNSFSKINRLNQVSYTFCMKSSLND